MDLNNKIGNLLCELRETQNTVKEVRADMLKVAFEAGLDQGTALKINVADWLDGYLVAQGIVPDYRKIDVDETVKPKINFPKVELIQDAEGNYVLQSYVNGKRL